MGINPASLGYVYPQQQQTNGTSRVWTGAKASLFGFGAAGAATYFGDFRGLTPVDANGNLFTEGLHIFEDASVQKGINDASFDAQKAYLGKNRLNVANAEELGKLSEFAKSGTVADAQKTLIEGLQTAKKTEITNGISKILADSTEGQLAKMNEFLKANGFKEVTELSQAQELIGKIAGGESADIIKAQVQKDVAKELATATDLGKDAAKIKARTTNIDAATKYLRELELRKAKFEALPATEQGILDLLKKESGKTGEELDKILPDLSKKAKRMFKQRNTVLNGGTLTKGGKEIGTIAKISDKIANQKGIVEELQSGLQAKFAQNFDKTKGVLKEGAPSELVKFFKNFKLHKALKYGAIAAGICLVGGLLFGGKD